jgi:sugar lactone lactonase YvrE
VSIFIDNNYTLYVCDRDNDRILKYVVNATTGIVAAGDGTSGNSPTRLNSPKGVAVDQMGDIIVGDSSNYRIQQFPLGSTVGITVAINSSVNILGQTRDLHIDVDNVIYVTDSDYSRIVKFYPYNGIGVILAGSSGPGSGPDQFNQPYGNFIDGNQTLFVADYGNDRVQMWTAGATNGTTVAGITSSSGSTLAKLNNPRAVVVDNNGYVISFPKKHMFTVFWGKKFVFIVDLSDGNHNDSVENSKMVFANEKEREK